MLNLIVRGWRASSPSRENRGSVDRNRETVGAQILTGLGDCGNGDAAQGSDFNPRFFADANHELQRALDWYFYLKAKSL
jgi:hypothetical protein